MEVLDHLWLVEGGGDAGDQRPQAGQDEQPAERGVLEGKLQGVEQGKGRLSLQGRFPHPRQEQG